MPKTAADPDSSRAARAARAATRGHGSNQVGLGQFNERVVLQAIRVHGATAKADLARLTRLSTQTVSLIINRLLDDGLVIKRGRVRGRIGQPSVPIALNPSGAFSIGVKIGRRSLDVLLVDFTGRVCARSSLDYPFPDPDTIFDEIGARVGELRRTLPTESRDRIIGVGVAAPLSLGGWQAMLQLDPTQAERWNQTDIRARVAQVTGLDAEFAKDTAAACVAELVAGRGQRLDSFLYLFVDTFIGGGIAIDGHLHAGIHGNAGAVASMPLGTHSGTGAAPPPGTPSQLLSAASLWTLERHFAAAGLDTTAVSDHRALQAPWLDATRGWLRDAAHAIGLAITTTVALLDLDAIVIDGSCDRDLLTQLITGCGEALESYDWEGLVRPQLLQGTHGGDARALGGAWLPIYARFAPDRNLSVQSVQETGGATAAASPRRGRRAGDLTARPTF